MNNLPEAPKRFNNRINEAFHIHNRKVRHEGLKQPILHFQESIGSHSSVSIRYVWIDNNSPHHLYVATWNNKEDWKIIESSVCCENTLVKQMVEEIMTQYCKEMNQYYNKSK